MRRSSARLPAGTAITGATVAVIAAAGCAHPTSGTGSHSTPVAVHRTTSSSAPPTFVPPTPVTTTTTVPPSPTTTPSSTAPRPRPEELPLGGRTILGRFRVVAYYGGPNGPALGALGNAPPEQMANVIAERARQFASFGLRVQPAMELITTVAQAGPGPDGRYSNPIPLATVQRYLAVARAHRMLLILDFQPGRGEFLPQVEQYASVLTDPHVSVALDPEWKMGPGQVPATVIGSSGAASINAVGAYLSRLVTAHRLPDKLLMVHQFTLGMLPDRDRIARFRGVETAFHADGFGTESQKLATWHRLAFPGRPWGTGFKLFLTQDTGLMTPAEVMALRPRPDVVTFQ